MSAASWRLIRQRQASLSDLGRVIQRSGACSSRSPAMMLEGASWRRPTSRTFSSPRGMASLSPSAPAGQRQARQFGTAIQPATKRHLYLVLDDHENEFSIHKLDLDNDDPDAGGCGSLENPLHFSEPPVLRVGPPQIRRGAQFAALGSHIIATCCKYGTLIFDTRTCTLDASDILPVDLRRPDLNYVYEVAIPVKNRLYVLDSHSNKEGGEYQPGGLHCIAENPTDHQSDWNWTWKPLSDSSRFSWSWTDYPLGFPFWSINITAHVVHPRTGTILVSTVGRQDRGTYSYRMGGKGEWKCRGVWVLPFDGHAPYDDALAAWVGLHLPSSQSHSDGSLCACPVTPGRQKPKWKVGGDKLFLNHPRWKHVDAKLVHMGGRSKYCLVERLLPEGADKSKYVLRLTMFTVKYDDDGEIRTMAHQPACFYKAPSYHYYSHTYFKVQPLQAFWL